MTRVDDVRMTEVRTGTRLHFGLFSTGSTEGRLGGIGLMVDRPRFVLRGRQADVDAIGGDDAGAVERVRRWLWELTKLRHVTANRCNIEPPSVRIEVVESIPAHHGFGSGTQLALALADLLNAQRIVFIGDRAKTFGRGRRSLVGTLGHDHGGFVVDAGDSQAERFETRVVLREVPDSWRFVIIDPAASNTYSGATESEAFRTLPAMPGTVSNRLAELVTDAILPALTGSDFQAFAAGVAAFNRLVGMHFAPVQGGTYAEPLIRELALTLRDTDWPHLAQSSWGPAAVVFCEDQDSAEALTAFLEGVLPRNTANVFIASPKNDGTVVEPFESQNISP